MKRLGQGLLVLSALLALSARGEQLTVAVAANFSSPMKSIETVFESAAQHELTVVSGSTGQLYAQILNGAPYDVFLAADRERPERLAQNTSAVGGTQFTYALGRLILWTREPALADNLSMDTLGRGGFDRLAMANPLLAPYGVAARQALQAIGVWDTLQEKIVRGENIAQTFAMVETRNAQLGLIALSSAIDYPGVAARVPVPPDHYEPIRQDAILLTRGRENPAAAAFLQFLRSAEARRIITEAGYGLP